MLYLASYDITDNKTRLRVANKLFGVGMERIQLSVFVGELTPARRRELLKAVELLLSKHTDASFVLIPISEYATQHSHTAGTSPIDWEYHRGQKLVLLIQSDA